MSLRMSSQGVETLGRPLAPWVSVCPAVTVTSRDWLLRDLGLTLLTTAAEVAGEELTCCPKDAH